MFSYCYMDFKDKYTTADLVNADKSGKEFEKTTLSNEAYAICEILENLVIETQKHGGIK